MEVRLQLGWQKRREKGTPGRYCRCLTGGLFWVLILCLGSVDGVAGALLPNSGSEAQAQAFYQAGDYDAAIQVWRSLTQETGIQTQPITQVHILHQIALAQQQLGDWGAAQMSLSMAESRLEALPPEVSASKAARSIEAQAWLLRGSLQFYLGQPQAAAQDWQRADERYRTLGNWQGQWQSQLLLVQAERRLGQWSAALERAQQLEQAIASSSTVADDIRQPLQLEALRLQAEVLRQLEQFDASQSRLTAALALQELATGQIPAAAQAELWLSLGHTAQAQGEWATAASWYERASQIPAAEISGQLARLTLGLVSNSLVLDQSDLGAAEAASWQAIAQSLSQRLATAPPQRRHLEHRIQLIYQLFLFNTLEPSPTSPTSLTALAYAAVQQAYGLEDTGAIAQALAALAQVQRSRQQWQAAESLTEEVIQLLQANPSSAAQQARLLAWLQGGRSLQPSPSSPLPPSSPSSPSPPSPQPEWPSTNLQRQAILALLQDSQWQESQWDILRFCRTDP